MPMLGLGKFCTAANPSRGVTARSRSGTFQRRLRRDHSAFECNGRFKKCGKRVFSEGCSAHRRTSPVRMPTRKIARCVAGDSPPYLLLTRPRQSADRDWDPFRDGSDRHCLASNEAASPMGTFLPPCHSMNIYVSEIASFCIQRQMSITHLHKFCRHEINGFQARAAGDASHCDDIGVC